MKHTQCRNDSGHWFGANFVRRGPGWGTRQLVGAFQRYLQSAVAAMRGSRYCRVTTTRSPESCTR